MSISQTLLYLYTETLLHVGTGSGLSNIDLPIQRERTTHYPTIAGSSIKGKLRATATMLNKQNNKQVSETVIAELFGSERENAQAQRTEQTERQTIKSRQEHAGALIVGDARLLLFPVRSLYGTFAYITSYYALHRFMRDAIVYLQTLPDWQVSDLPEALNTPYALVTDESQVTSGNTLILEEYNFTAKAKPIVTKIAEWLANNALPQRGNTYFINKLKHSLVILSDNDFNDFISYSTEVVTRVSIQTSTKTVTEGGLWTEENLPSDTLLYVPIYATDSRLSSENQQNVFQKKTGEEILTSAAQILPSGKYIQLGGDETVGRGLVRTRWASNGLQSTKQEEETIVKEER
jgi:CRISPR-associated protein Cmr4